MTDHEFHILHHAIGAPAHQALCDDPYRNRYCAAGLSPDCERLVEAGFLDRGPRVDDLVYYRVTLAGIDEVRRRLPALRAWYVETKEGTDIVHAATRAKARMAVARSIREAWGCGWLEALREIRSVTLSRKPINCGEVECMYGCK